MKHAVRAGGEAEPVRKSRQESAHPRVGITGMCVLVAFQNEHRIYGKAIARAIQELRPSVEVTVAEAGMVGEEVGRLLPELVISSRAKTVGAAREPAWIELSGTRPTVQDLCWRPVLEVASSFFRGAALGRGRDAEVVRYVAHATRETVAPANSPLMTTRWQDIALGGGYEVA